MIDTITKAIEGANEGGKDKIPDFTKPNDLKGGEYIDKIPDFEKTKDLFISEVSKKMEPIELSSSDENNGIEKEVDDSKKIKTINEGLEGKKHPVTEVPYEKDTLPDGREGVFPVFDPIVEVQLSEEEYLETDNEQFKSSNKSLKEQIENNPDLKAEFSKEQLEQIENGRTPSGYTWHHHQQDGKMQLISTEVHDKSAHTGGKALWGGGKENR